MKKIKKIIAGALIGAALFSINVFAAGTIPSGTVILGDKAYGLDYANNKANENEISQAVVNSGGKVYIKLFTGEYVDNVTSKPVSQSEIKVATYKDEKGTVTIDGSSESSDSLEVISIE